MNSMAHSHSMILWGWLYISYVRCFLVKKTVPTRSTFNSSYFYPYVPCNLMLIVSCFGRKNVNYYDSPIFQVFFDHAPTTAPWTTAQLLRGHPMNHRKWMKVYDIHLQAKHGSKSNKFVKSFFHVCVLHFMMDFNRGLSCCRFLPMTKVTLT